MQSLQFVSRLISQKTIPPFVFSVLLADSDCKNGAITRLITNCYYYILLRTLGLPELIPYLRDEANNGKDM